MTVANPPRPLLLVLAHGVGASEIAALRAAAGWNDLPAPAPLAMPPRPIHTILHDSDAARELHGLGIFVDRSSLVLRPRLRTDATAVEMMAKRPTGPAPVTLFEATSVLSQAASGGSHAATAAVRELGKLLDHLCNLLRRGDQPEVWFVGLGTAHLVHTTFDLAAAWHRHVLPPRSKDLALRVSRGSAWITGDNQRALDLAARQLQAPPFVAHGILEASGAGHLCLRARQGTGFGTRRMVARTAHAGEADGVFAAPVGDTARQRGIDLAGLMARFWMRAAQLHAALDNQGTEPARDPTPRIEAIASSAADRIGTPSTR